MTSDKYWIKLGKKNIPYFFLILVYMLSIVRNISVYVHIDEKISGNKLTNVAEMIKNMVSCSTYMKKNIDFSFKYGRETIFDRSKWNELLDYYSVL